MSAPELQRRLPPSPYADALLRAKLPEPVISVTRVLVDQITPAPDPTWLVAQFGTDPARHLKEAWRAGERDKGRLAYLVARYVLRMPAEMAWGAVPKVAQAFPGSVDPAFLAEAEGHVRASFGAMTPPSADEDSWMPAILLGLVGLSVWVAKDLMNLSDKKVSHA